MLDRPTREYLLKQSSTSLVELVEGWERKANALHERIKMARGFIQVNNYGAATDCLDLRKRKDLDR